MNYNKKKKPKTIWPKNLKLLETGYQVIPL